MTIFLSVIQVKVLLEVAELAFVDGDLEGAVEGMKQFLTQVETTIEGESLYGMPFSLGCVNETVLRHQILYNSEDCFNPSWKGTSSFYYSTQDNEWPTKERLTS